METREIPDQEREAFFDKVTRAAKGKFVQIEVLGEEIGDQLEEEWTKLDGLSYDPNDDTIYVHTAPMDHAIHFPVEVVTIEEDLSIKYICVADKEGLIQIIHFQEPLRLQAPLDEQSPLNR